jgi:hypothetical protein
MHFFDRYETLIAKFSRTREWQVCDGSTLDPTADLGLYGMGETKNANSYSIFNIQGEENRDER